MKHQMEVLVTRDEDGTLCMWKVGAKPERARYWWDDDSDGASLFELEEFIKSDALPALKWTDEPVRMTLTLEEVEGGS